ncbi:MAG: SH3 domain-containing protein [Spirulinaceae cyanobacterium RM2_2_10]|nr:SH3 domain-containing protein [Spirulinaceae cyanobacterium SM2_1_0]NJO21050.1 SH3 domain-containing protein [Spirulinaceae cyanobacterium RM2_2_10]
MRAYLLLASCLLGFGSLLLPPAPTIAQTPDGQCRQANRRMEIFSEPTVGPNSRFVRTLQPGEQVVLAGSANNGWIPVQVPTVGFVIARYLTACGTAVVPPTPPTRPATACRRATLNLAIRPRPVAGTEPVVGGVAEGQTVTITQTTQRDADGRIWFEIVAPSRGWVSGGRAGTVNLTSC